MEERLTVDDTEDTTIYSVVVNDEEQYSVWPDHLEKPAGWRATGTSGSREHCLQAIREVWSDMRPRSLCEGLENDIRHP